MAQASPEVPTDMHAYEHGGGQLPAYAEVLLTVNPSLVSGNTMQIPAALMLSDELGPMVVVRGKQRAHAADREASPAPDCHRSSLSA